MIFVSREVSSDHKWSQETHSGCFNPRWTDCNTFCLWSDVSGHILRPALERGNGIYIFCTIVGTMTIGQGSSKHQLQRHDPKPAPPTSKAELGFCQSSSKVGTPAECQLASIQTETDSWRSGRKDCSTSQKAPNTALKPDPVLMRGTENNGSGTSGRTVARIHPQHHQSAPRYNTRY